MRIFAAYNDYGDLIAHAHSYWFLVAELESCGYDLDEVFICAVTP